VHIQKIGDIFASHPPAAISWKKHHYARRLTNEMFSGCLLYNSLAEQSSLLAMARMNECVKRKGKGEKESDFDRKQEKMRGGSQLSPFSYAPPAHLTNKQTNEKA
jgi:hypothetical protein